MATVTVVRAQPVEPPIEKVIVEMTLEQAQDVQSLVGVAPWTGSRANLYNALSDALPLSVKF